MASIIASFFKNKTNGNAVYDWHVSLTKATVQATAKHVFSGVSPEKARAEREVLGSNRSTREPSGK